MVVVPEAELELEREREREIEIMEGNCLCAMIVTHTPKKTKSNITKTTLQSKNLKFLHSRTQIPSERHYLFV